MLRDLFFIAALIPAFAACQAMMPGTLALKGGDGSGRVVVSPDSPRDEESPPAPDSVSPASTDPVAPASPVSKAPSAAFPASPAEPSAYKSPIGPLAKVDDPMGPKADLGDPLGGGDRPAATKRYFCSIYHVEPSGERVAAGVGSPSPPLFQPGRNTLQARFYAEILEAPLECETAACWTSRPVQPGHYVQLVVYPKGERHYQTAMVTQVGPDGANVGFSGAPIQDGEEVGFSHIPLSDPPFTASALTPMTDEAWLGSGVDCDFGRFTVKTGDGTVYRPLSLPRAKIPDPAVQINRSSM